MRHAEFDVRSSHCLRVLAKERRKFSNCLNLEQSPESIPEFRAPSIIFNIYLFWEEINKKLCDLERSGCFFVEYFDHFIVLFMFSAERIEKQITKYYTYLPTETKNNNWENNKLNVFTMVDWLVTLEPSSRDF